jgi:hypothetical protein
MNKPDKARRRRPLSRAMLLPLSASRRRELQIRHHIAFETLKRGQGKTAQIGALLNMLYVSFYLRQHAGETDPDMYRCAERALLDCAAAAEKGGDVVLSDEACTVMERLLGAYDRQLEVVPLYLCIDAWNRLSAMSDFQNRPSSRNPPRTSI